VIGSKIKLIRGSKGRKEFIKDLQLNMDVNYLYMVETGRRNPGRELLLEISEKTKVPVSFFLDDNIEELKCLPIELSDLGMEYIFVAKEAQQNGLSPEELHKLIELASFMKKHD
jgi:transcriptional regulator with XRE-family HTH domain